MILFEEEQLKKNLHPDLFNLIKSQLTSIEVPSNEEIEKSANSQSHYEGAMWLKYKILNQIK